MSDDWNGPEQTFRDTERNLRNLIKAQAAEIERLSEALAFYANGMEPFGNTARNALENKP